MFSERVKLGAATGLEVTAATELTRLADVVSEQWDLLSLELTGWLPNLQQSPLLHLKFRFMTVSD